MFRRIPIHLSYWVSSWAHLRQLRLIELYERDAIPLVYTPMTLEDLNKLFGYHNKNKN